MNNFFGKLYASKENVCFDEFTTFPDMWSDLYLNAFVIVVVV